MPVPGSMLHARTAAGEAPPELWRSHAPIFEKRCAADRPEGGEALPAGLRDYFQTAIRMMNSSVNYYCKSILAMQFRLVKSTHFHFSGRDNIFFRSTT